MVKMSQASCILATAGVKLFLLLMLLGVIGSGCAPTNGALAKMEAESQARKVEHEAVMEKIRNPTVVDVTKNKPSDNMARALIDAWLSISLKDPHSAKVRVTNPDPFTCSSKKQDGKAVRAWAYAAFVNARNSYGAYTGEKLYLFLFNGDELAAVSSPDSIPLCQIFDDKL